MAFLQKKMTKSLFQRTNVDETADCQRSSSDFNRLHMVCGYVRGKNTTGSETGDKPFLYLVREDVAYVGGYNMATSPYHNLCNK